ncbi:MAG: hypothetical protein JWN72_766, partial [Thermoleophilia bacterium]|nr:hypothetical protein [Thermoleophilia bacterium]
VTAGREADAVVCRVIDTGPGIAKSDQLQLFQRFSQLDEGMRRGGTGLGLNISKAIVEAHGGTIDYGRTFTGRTRFRVRVPLAHE